jgi:hypothetical protein
MDPRLIYIGSGGIPGIPARNLSDEDIEKYAKPALEKAGVEEDPEVFLLASGLYESPIKFGGGELTLSEEESEV